MLILTACLSIYGATAFQTEEVIGVKTLSGRDVNRDPVQSSDGWAKFTSGWLVGGLSGVAWSYFLTQVLPATLKGVLFSQRTAEDVFELFVFENGGGESRRSAFASSRRTTEEDF